MVVGICVLCVLRQYHPIGVRSGLVHGRCLDSGRNRRKQFHQQRHCRGCCHCHPRRHRRRGRRGLRWRWRVVVAVPARVEAPAVLR